MKVSVKVPTSLEAIKLSQHQKFLKTTEGSKDDAWINKQLVSIFCNLSDHVVKNIKKRDYNKIINELSKVVDLEGTFKPIITHEGKEYGFIPNLQDITVGEQADLESVINDWQKMGKACAIMYRPIKSKRKDKYLIEDYTGEEPDLDLNMDVVRGALVFFYNLMKDLLNCTQNYMKALVHQPKILQTLEKNGVGINQFTESLNLTISGLKKYLKESSTQNYYSCLLKQIKTS